MKISRILHAGYLFERGGTTLIFDPVFENPFSRNCHAFPDVAFDHDAIRNMRVSAVFISHYHDDHCSFDSLNLLDRSTPIYMYCVHAEMFELIRSLGFSHVCPLAIDVSIQIGEFEVTPRRALDEDVDSLFQIRAAGLNVLNVVDSWIGPDTLEQLIQMKPWNLILWPFQTMREVEVLSPSRASKATGELPSEWIQQLKKLEPAHIVPSSCQFVLEKWSWYNRAFFPISYAGFQKQLEAALPQTQVIRMDPGISVTLNQSGISCSEPLPWMRSVGPQNVDYEYDADLVPPSTASIAQRFEKLSEAQLRRVMTFCEIELIQTYASLEASQEPCFKQTRHWQLSLFDHMGEAVHFYYVLKGASMNLSDQCFETISWKTEVPISKLYAALECGEALTSMYIRINDCVFSVDIENEIQDADAVEDPLIRVLFTGKFAAYQKAQLSAHT